MSTWKPLTADSSVSNRGQVILHTGEIYLVFDRQTTPNRTAQVIASFKSERAAQAYCRRLPKAAA